MHTNAIDANISIIQILSQNVTFYRVEVPHTPFPILDTPLNSHPNPKLVQRCKKNPKIVGTWKTSFHREAKVHSSLLIWKIWIVNRKFYITKAVAFSHNVCINFFLWRDEVCFLFVHEIYREHHKFWAKKSPFVVSSRYKIRSSFPRAAHSLPENEKIRKDLKLPRTPWIIVNPNIHHLKVAWQKLRLEKEEVF